MKSNYKNKETKIGTQKAIETRPKKGEKEKNEIKNEKKIDLVKKDVIPKNIKMIYQIRIKRINFIIFILILLINSISTSILNKKFLYNIRILEDDSGDGSGGADPDNPDPDPDADPEPRVKRPQEIIIRVSKNGEQQLIWEKFDNFSNFPVEFSFFDENDNDLVSNGFKVNVTDNNKASIYISDIIIP